MQSHLGVMYLRLGVRQRSDWEKKNSTPFCDLSPKGVSRKLRVHSRRTTARQLFPEKRRSAGWLHCFNVPPEETPGPRAFAPHDLICFVFIRRTRSLGDFVCFVVSHGSLGVPYASSSGSLEGAATSGSYADQMAWEFSKGLLRKFSYLTILPTCCLPQLIDSHGDSRFAPNFLD